VQGKPQLVARGDVFAEFVGMQLPPVPADLVLAAVMSTPSEALIATATVFSQDIVGRLRAATSRPHDHIRSNRSYVAELASGLLAQQSRICLASAPRRR
jgi:solute:Na+ symporter, SSS family